MHGGRMPAQVHRVNAAKAGVVEWTTGWLSVWSGSRDLHHGGRARISWSPGRVQSPASGMRLECPSPALRACLAREERRQSRAFRHEYIDAGLMPRRLRQAGGWRVVLIMSVS